jgi:hypothetical protein
MAIIKWRGRVYSFSIAWGLIPLAIVVFLTAVFFPFIDAIRAFFAR